jgi:hypothetical protein
MPSSMVRCDLLDVVEWCLRSVRDRADPFGGGGTMRARFPAYRDTALTAYCPVALSAKSPYVFCGEGVPPATAARLMTPAASRSGRPCRPLLWRVTRSARRRVLDRWGRRARSIRERSPCLAISRRNF